MLCIWILIFFADIVLSSTTIIKIDDTFGDSLTGAVPQYTVANIWYARSNPYDCDFCVAHPDNTQMLFGTWHEEETVPHEPAANISFIFSGTTLRIYCTLVGNIVGHVGSTNFVNTRLSFFLDNNSTAIAEFLHNPPPGSTDYLYQQTVFQSTSLPPGNHQMNISTWSDGITGSLILFDYAEYEIGGDDESTGSVDSSQDSSHGRSTPSSLSTSASAHSSSLHGSASTSLSTTSSKLDGTTSPNGPSSSYDPSLSLPLASTISSTSESSETETTNSSSTSSSHPSNAAAVGVGIATAIVVVLLLGLWLKYRRQRKQRSREEDDIHLVETPVKIGRARSMSIEPYDVSPPLPVVPRRVVVREAKLASYDVARALSWPATLVDRERGVYPPQDALTQLQVDLGTFN